MRHLVFAPLVLALAAIAAPAQAAVTLKLDGFIVGTSKGTGAADSASNAALSRTMQWAVTGVGAEWDIAGQFYGSVTEGGVTGSFAGYCVELSQGFNPFPTGNLTYDKVDGKTYFSSAVYDKIGRLYSQNLTLDTADKTAAFQIALWEVMYETSGTLAVGNSSLAGSADFLTRPSGTATTSTFLLAQSYLDAIATTPFDQSKIGLVVYTNGSSQDLIVAIPEPATYAMMLIGLTGLGFMSLSRNRRQD